MPELPEVETIKRGLEPRILHKKITKVIILQSQLRWEIPQILTNVLLNDSFQSLNRRGKYLLCFTSKGTLIFHFGFTGSLQVLPSDFPFQAHEHLRINFNDNTSLCYTDPRKFGACLWTVEDPTSHPLIKVLGIEPLTADFNAEFLFEAVKKRKAPIKQLIMDSHIIAGVGNIYANEALFEAKIHPLIPAQNLSKSQCVELVNSIKIILNIAIQKGGTTIRDYINSEGKSGYFQQELKVYGRRGQPCKYCHTPINEMRLAQRSTFYCPKCQPIRGLIV